jgi:hypothetical protein
MNFTIPAFALKMLVAWLLPPRREPDFIIGQEDPGGPYLKRWYLKATPWRRWKNKLARRFFVAYLHQFLRSDDDRALHDHPSWAISLILVGEYTEHTIDYGGVHRRHVWKAGSIRFLRTTHAHRIELHDGPCWTLFIFGPQKRLWGFHCPQRGWVPWYDFTAEGKPGERGKGCEA